MPRKARIDAPGSLHHIICRGIERKKIFKNDKDRLDFIERLETVLISTQTICYAWALIPNHFHLLLKTGGVPIATVMRRLLTGYAVSFNRRNRRHGHLFQNRYKSILCQEDSYLLELVRYIHLNPYRAKQVKSVEDLNYYPFCGHSRLLGHISDEWQDTDSVLIHFAKRVSTAREKYLAFVEEGSSQGRRMELTGGGLVRIAGGWQQVKMLQKMQIKIKSDERILGDNEFADFVLREAEENLARKDRYNREGFNFDKALDLAARMFSLGKHDMLSAGKQPRRVQARSLLCYWAVRELGISATSAALKLNLTQSAVSRSVQRGEKLANEEKYQLDKARKA